MRGHAVSRSSAPAHGLRARLVVLSDRRPAPDRPRTGVEAAIEAALREHDGVWLVRPAEAAGAAAGRPRWSVLDGDPASPRSSADEWTGYVRANASYAERIVELISPDGTVWIYGHRWLLVGAALRGHGHRGPIGLLLDAPFPARARIEALPWYADVMGALGQLDLVGFRAPACADNFEACRGRAGQDRPRIGVFPDGAGAAPRGAPVTCGVPVTWVSSFLQLLGSAARRDEPVSSLG